MLHLKQLYKLFLCLFSFLVFHIFDISSRQTLQMIFQPLNLIYSRLSCNQPLNKPFDQAAESQSSGFNVPYFFFVFISHVRTLSFIFLSSSSFSHWTLCLASLPLSLSLWPECQFVIRAAVLDAVYFGLGRLCRSEQRESFSPQS